MKTLQLALAPGALAGIIAVFTSWFWMGFVFHGYQRLTPNTWRPENNRSYLLSSVVTILACIAIATVFLLVARMGGVFAGGLPGAFRFAAVAWMALAAPVVVNAAIFINLHPWFVVGQVINVLTNSVLACTVTACWRQT